MDERYLWCPVCGIGLEESLTEDEADGHVIRHVAEGRWPNASVSMVLASFARRLIKLSAVKDG